MTRVVGGVAGGRRLATPSGQGTRPTPDRVREALFSALDSRLTGLEGRSLLDLFAGSGAIGCEALSRGMAPVVLVENDRRAVAVIRANLEVVGLPGGRLQRVDATAFVTRPADASFDVVFADPPYALTDSEVSELLARLTRSGWLAPDALVVVERSSRSGPVHWPNGIVAQNDRRYGETTLWYGRHHRDPKGADEHEGE